MPSLVTRLLSLVDYMRAPSPAEIRRRAQTSFTQPRYPRTYRLQIICPAYGRTFVRHVEMTSLDTKQMDLKTGLRNLVKDIQHFRS